MQEELEVSWYWRSTQAHAPSRASSGGGERGQRRGAEPVVWVSFEVRGRYSHMQVAAGVLGIGTSVGDWRIRAGASRRLSDVINNNSLAVLVCEGWSWAPRDREGECRGGRRTKGPREIRGGGQRPARSIGRNPSRIGLGKFFTAAGGGRSVVRSDTLGKCPCSGIREALAIAGAHARPSFARSSH